MRKRSVLVGVWALSTLAATLIAWGAVQLVTDEVAPETVLPLPTAVALADVDRSQAAQAGPRQPRTTAPRSRGSDAPAQPPPAADDPPEEGAADDPPAARQDQQPDPRPEPEPEPEPEPVTEAYQLVGGVVTVRYQGTSADLVEASPQSGFVVEVHDGGPGKVDVRFRSDSHESRFITRIRNGTPDPEREERPR